MNSSGNNVNELKKEIRSLKKKINDLIELCKAGGVHEEIIFRTLQNTNNSSKRFANQEARFIEHQARNENQARNEQKALSKLQEDRILQQSKIQEEARKAQQARNAQQFTSKSYNNRSSRHAKELELDRLFYLYSMGHLNNDEYVRLKKNVEQGI
jgi:hypothetical protein